MNVEHTVYARLASAQTEWQQAMPSPVSHAPAKTCLPLLFLLLPTWQLLAWLPLFSTSSSSSATKCHSHVLSAWQYSSSPDNSDLFPPHLSHLSFPAWQRRVPCSLHKERLMLIRLVELGRRSTETKMVRDTARMHMYEYTHTYMHNLRRKMAQTHSANRRDLRCYSVEILKTVFFLI